MFSHLFNKELILHLGLKSNTRLFFNLSNNTFLYFVFSSIIEVIVDVGNGFGAFWALIMGRVFGGFE